MIADLSSYQIADFILFSKEILYRIFESYNREIWPMQIGWLLVTGSILYCSRKNRAIYAKIISALMAGAWAWVGLVFHLGYFMPVNWAAKYFAWLFVAEAILFLLLGVFGGKLQTERVSQPARWSGYILLFTAGFVPLGILLGQSLPQSLLFGWGPDQTALGTIGLLLLYAGHWAKWILMVPPALWLILAALMYYGLLA